MHLKSSMLHFSLCTSLAIFFLCLFHPVFGGGIKGKIISDDNKPLPYASIFIKETGSGTTSNSEGYYEIGLKPGHYEVVYQYIGYATELREVDVKDDFHEINISLKPQVIVLKDVIIKAGKEDPAYTIIRKAIAKAKYHTQAVDSYKAKVYLKGSGKLKDYPWLFKGKIEKEGIRKNQVFIVESLSEIEYTRPNNLKEKVISVRSDGKDNNTVPNQFIFGSFYQPKVAGFISPLSPKAFSYYKFEYLGTFQDREYLINRIKVTPRSKGEDVVEGVIYVVENMWSLHSLELLAKRSGLGIKIKTLYAPIEDKAWLPVSQKFEIEGKIMGFDFEYDYLATLSNYKIVMNPALYVEKMQLIDDKVDKAAAGQIEEKSESKKSQFKERVEAGEEVTRKQLKVYIKEYEKEERKKLPEPEVVASRNFTTDSMAFKKDSEYWQSVRPVPLTKDEAKGYEKWDSLAVAKREKWQADSLKSERNKGFQPRDLIFGDKYRLSEYSDFKLDPIEIQFNTVEGYNLSYNLTYGTYLKKDTTGIKFSVSPKVRYAFARETVSGFLNLGIDNEQFQLNVEGGRYVRQFNPDAINATLNSLTTLLLEQNFMKLYERDYARISFSGKLNSKFSVSTGWDFSQRKQLANMSEHKLVNREKIEDYSSNFPANIELQPTGFPKHEALIGEVSLSASPWSKYWVRNGKKHIIKSSSPQFMLTYRKGLEGVFNSDVDFDQVELGAKYRFSPFTRGLLNLSVNAGSFLNDKSLYFMDYKHFPGNRRPFIVGGPDAAFRLLDYYKYSTSGMYFTVHASYQFRQFLITRIPAIRLLGIKENIFINYLTTEPAKGYIEAGYGLDGILRFFKIEAVVAFKDGAVINSGIRIGIATNILVSVGRK